MSDLKNALEDISQGVATLYNLIEYFDTACKCTKNINMGLENLVVGLENMYKILKDIKKSDDQITEKMKKDAATEAMKGRVFMTQVVDYYARWVAMKVFATLCYESLDRTAKTLKCSTEITTQQEAAEQFQAALECPNFLQLTYPTQDLEQGGQAESQHMIGRTHGRELGQ